MKWSQVRQAIFIMQRLEKVGHITRADLAREFCVTTDHARRVFQKFNEIYPFAMRYNPARKRYEAATRNQEAA